MISTAEALYDFLSGFGIPAYGKDTVPDDAVLPYLTFPIKEPHWNSPTTFYVTVYYLDEMSSRASILKADEIVNEIGDMTVIPCTGGYVVLRPDNPVLQELPPEGNVRGTYINLQLNAFKTYDVPAEPDEAEDEPGAQTPAENEEREDE